jgi:hypothetical protein
MPAQAHPPPMHEVSLLNARHGSGLMHTPEMQGSPSMHGAPIATHWQVPAARHVSSSALAEHGSFARREGTERSSEPRQAAARKTTNIRKCDLRMLMPHGAATRVPRITPIECNSCSCACSVFVIGRHRSARKFERVGNTRQLCLADTCASSPAHQKLPASHAPLNRTCVYRSLWVSPDTDCPGGRRDHRKSIAISANLIAGNDRRAHRVRHRVARIDDLGV